MGIRIIDEPDIVLTHDEHERLSREWEAAQRMTVAPLSFEAWLRRRGRPVHPSHSGFPKKSA